MFWITTKWSCLIDLWISSNCFVLEFHLELEQLWNGLVVMTCEFHQTVCSFNSICFFFYKRLHFLWMSLNSILIAILVGVFFLACDLWVSLYCLLTSITFWFRMTEKWSCLHDLWISLSCFYCKPMNVLGLLVAGLVTGCEWIKISLANKVPITHMAPALKEEVSCSHRETWLFWQSIIIQTGKCDDTHLSVQLMDRTGWSSITTYFILVLINWPS